MHVVFIRARRCQQTACHLFDRLQTEADAFGVAGRAGGVGDFQGCRRQLHCRHIHQRKLGQPALGNLILLRRPYAEPGALQQMLHDNRLIGDQLVDAGIANGMRQLLC